MLFPCMFACLAHRPFFIYYFFILEAPNFFIWRNGTKWKTLSRHFVTTYRKGKGDLAWTAWWPGKSLHVFREVDLGMAPLSLPPRTPILGKLVLWPSKFLIDFTYSGNEFQWSHTVGSFLLWPLCATPLMTDTHFFPSVMHPSLCSAPSCLSGFLTSYRKIQLLGWFCSFMFLHLRLVNRIFGKVLQSSAVVRNTNRSK
jgi:hypothetical protein